MRITNPGVLGPVFLSRGQGTQYGIDGALQEFDKRFQGRAVFFRDPPGSWNSGFGPKYLKNGMMHQVSWLHGAEAMALGIGALKALEPACRKACQSFVVNLGERRYQCTNARQRPVGVACFFLHASVFGGNLNLPTA